MKLLDQVVIVARRRRLAQSTIDVYRLWIRQFLTFSAARLGRWKPPEQLGTAEVEAFLNDLVMRRRLSASAQNQALCALVFLYEQVLADVIPQDHLGKFLLQRSRRPQRLPTVLSIDEVRRMIEAVEPTRMSRLMIELLYGTGMRISEAFARCGSGILTWEGRRLLSARPKEIRTASSCCQPLFAIA